MCVCAFHAFYKPFFLFVYLFRLILLVCFIFASLFPKVRELGGWEGGRIWDKMREEKL